MLNGYLLKSKLTTKHPQEANLIALGFQNLSSLAIHEELTGGFQPITKRRNTLNE